MVSFFGSNELLCFFQSSCKIGRTAGHIVRIGCKDMDKPFLQHSLSPIAWTPTESPAK